MKTIHEFPWWKVGDEQLWYGMMTEIIFKLIKVNSGFHSKYDEYRKKNLKFCDYLDIYVDVECKVNVRKIDEKLFYLMEN